MSKTGWGRVALEVYEEHMATPGVDQTPQLNRIVARQLADHKPAALLYLGVAGGNGLEHVDVNRTRRLTAVDVNSEFLRICGERNPRLKDVMQLVEMDLSACELELPTADLVIANLLVEYVGVERFVALARANRTRWRSISCVTQRDNGAPFVSASAHAETLTELLCGTCASVDERVFCDAMEAADWRLCRREVYALPNGKDFLRLDFRP